MAALTKTRAIAATATTAVAALTAATALAVPPPPSSTFKGKTNQPKAKYHKTKVVTDANGHVSVVSVGWRAPCRKKGIFWSTETKITGGDAGVPQTGEVFHEAGTYTGHAGAGVTGVITISMKGRFSDNDHVFGTWSAKVTVKKKGKTIDKCKQSGIKWKASRVA
jgi:hypothetical protein